MITFYQIFPFILNGKWIFEFKASVVYGWVYNITIKMNYTVLQSGQFMNKMIYVMVSANFYSFAHGYLVIFVYLFTTTFTE